MSAVVPHHLPGDNLLDGLNEIVELDCHADYLEVGDVIVHPDRIPLLVTRVSTAVQGFVVVSYTCAAGDGQRTYADKQHLTIVRPELEESH